MWLKMKGSIAYITNLPLPVGKETKTSLLRQNWYTDSNCSFFKTIQNFSAPFKTAVLTSASILFA